MTARVPPRASLLAGWTRARAKTKPSSVPPAKATSERATVHRAASMR